MLERGYRHFVVDLNSCTVMDSTFMGTLAGIALRLREFGNGSLLVRNANERNWDLLQNLGLNNLFDVESKGSELVTENLVGASPLEADHSIDLRKTTAAPSAARFLNKTTTCRESI